MKPFVPQFPLKLYQSLTTKNFRLCKRKLVDLEGIEPSSLIISSRILIKPLNHKFINRFSIRKKNLTFQAPSCAIKFQVRKKAFQEWVIIGSKFFANSLD